MAWLEFNQICKTFPGVVALDQVTFGLGMGGCHALMGENGAGKSTLGKILAGVYNADSGTLKVDGKVIAPGNPLQARALGIAMVHQELAFCPNLSVAENLCLGALPSRAGFLKKGEMAARAGRMLRQIHADFDLDAPISSLSTAQEQLVQIAAAVGINARIIVMDEPTSSLSARESESLFELISDLKQQGVTIIYVSHRIEEIFRICDTTTVLRDGRHVATQSIRESTPDKLVEQMIGRELDKKVARQNVPVGGEILRVEGLCSPGKFRDIHFNLRKGEILGLAGLVGAGRSELAQAIFGLDTEATGRLFVNGREVPLAKVQKSLAAGIGLVPEDRKRQGLVLSMNCRENTSLATLAALSWGGFLQRSRERETARAYIQQLQVRTPGLENGISGLSGGNQQKIALAKWLARDCGILIVDEPTRGVDVGAKAEIHLLLENLAAAGKGILLISSELPEMLRLANRVIVLREGNQMGEVGGSEITSERLMRLMAGMENRSAA